MSEDLERELLQAIRELTAAVRAQRRPSSSDTLSIEETATQLGCSVSRVYQLLKKKKLARGKKAGRHTRVTASSVLEYQGIEAAPAPAELHQDVDDVERGSRFRELAKRGSGT